MKRPLFHGFASISGDLQLHQPSHRAVRGETPPDNRYGNRPCNCISCFDSDVKSNRTGEGTAGLAYNPVHASLCRRLISARHCGHRRILAITNDVGEQEGDGGALCTAFIIHVFTSRLCRDHLCRTRARPAPTPMDGPQDRCNVSVLSTAVSHPPRSLPDSLPTSATAWKPLGVGAAGGSRRRR